MTDAQITYSVILLISILAAFIAHSLSKKTRASKRRLDKLLDNIQNCKSRPAWQHWYERSIQFENAEKGNLGINDFLQLRAILLAKAYKLNEEMFKR